MTTKPHKLIAGLLSVSTLLAASAPSFAEANDFQAQVIRRAAQAAQQKRSNEAVQVLGMKLAPSLESLDLTTEFTNAELATLESGVARLAQRKLGDAHRGSQLVQKLEAHHLANGSRLRAAYVYMGVTAGEGVGVTGDLALVFGHDRRTGDVAVYPMLILKLKGLVAGVDIHFGVGAIEGRTPALTAGLMLGGAFAVGAGVGFGGNLTSSRGRGCVQHGPPAGEGYLELKIGLSLEAGGYIGIVL